MVAVHSIEYDALPCYFMLFGLRSEHGAAHPCIECGNHPNPCPAVSPIKRTWQSWDDVQQMAESLSLQTVPVLFRGKFASLAQIQVSIIKMVKALLKVMLLGIFESTS
jgi:hypothetical protein